MNEHNAPDVPSALSGMAYPFEQWNIKSCWINRQDRCAYTLICKSGNVATFKRGDGKILTLPREEAVRVMGPT